ncbi:MAG TPA: tRNA pseudouridine(13) synthase TruD [Myxococcota bacterium]|jgi:tRNA pseudouridine13 synthase
MVRLRSQPEDFRVDEIPLYAPSGEGGHTFLLVEKRLRTTEEVASELARAGGIRSAEIGYAGRKDRVAVTTQWFSVQGLAPEAALAIQLPGVRVIEARRHPHKLRTGQLRGNRFEIVAREVDPETLRAVPARLECLRNDGMPNRFGPQRFGWDRGNLEQARRLLRGEKIGADRRHARFLLSALQAAAFNAVLSERPLPLSALELGDVAVVHASGGLFRVEDPVREAPRAAAFEISATGPVFGTRVLSPSGAAAERERAAFAAVGVDPDKLRTPAGIRLRGARRALRVRMEAADAVAEGDTLRLCFTLPAGSYASVALEELLGAECKSDDTRPGPALS